MTEKELYCSGSTELSRIQRYMYFLEYMNNNKPLSMEMRKDKLKLSSNWNFYLSWTKRAISYTFLGLGYGYITSWWITSKYVYLVTTISNAAILGYHHYEMDKLEKFKLADNYEKLSQDYHCKKLRNNLVA